MKIALAIVLASVLFASCGKHPSNVVLEPGEYLHEQYIQGLRDTRSPLKAGEGGGRLSYQVRSDKGIVSISGIESFHEGAESFSFRILSDGSVRFAEPPDAQPSPVITVPNTRSFNMAWPKGSRTESSPDYGEGGKYDWVGEEAEMWVMRQILVGQYRTPDGFDVSLDPDGKFSLPHKSGRCKAGLDHILTDFDYLYGPDCNYGFRFEGGALLLFAIYEGESGIEKIRSTPTWRLYRRSPPDTRPGRTPEKGGHSR